MKLSHDGLNLIKAFEGCLKPIGGGKFKPYVCPAGVLTIGWGHTNHHGRKFDKSSVWTQEECDAELASDMARFEAAVAHLVKVPLTQYQNDALVSFAYNCGDGNLSKSTLLKKINAGDMDGAAQEFQKWNKGAGKVLKGLVRRRASESLLFRNVPDYDYDGVPDAMPQQVDAPETDAPLPSSSNVEARVAQEALKNLGYLEVGICNGEWGSRSVAAMSAFEHDRGIEINGLLDDDSKAELEAATDEGWKRPVSQARSTSTPDDSRIIDGAQKQGQVGLWATISGVFIAAGNWVSDKSDTVREIVESLGPALKPLKSVLAEHWPILLIAFGGIVLWQAMRIQKARIEDHQMGKTS